MSTVLERIGAVLKQNAFTRAIVIDDSLEPTEGGVALDKWMEVLEILRDGHAESLEKIRALFTGNGFPNLEIEPPVELLPDMRRIVEETGVQDAIQLMEGQISTEPELTAIVEHLNELELEVLRHRSIDTAPLDANLVFLDFSINETAEDAGTAATAYLRKLVERAKDTNSVPAVFLMSRNRPTRQEWEEVADAAAYLRFCFRYRDKTELAVSTDIFFFHLEELLEAWPLGQIYLRHLTTVKKSIHGAIDTVISQLMRLTPADFSSFARMKLKDVDGIMGARHLRYLISQLLTSELDGSAEVSEALRDFGKTLADTPLRHTDHESLALHDLQGQILYDCSEATTTGSIMFGDILRQDDSGSTKYFLVLTPECDLELRDAGRPKAEYLLLLEGEPVNQPTQDDYKECTPLMRPNAGAPCQWMCWNFRRPRTFPFDDLIEPAKKGFARWGRMNREHAERLQQRFASDLLEVGTESFIEGTWQHKVQVFAGRAGTDNKGTLTIVEMIVAETRLWALAGDADILFREAGREILSPDLVRDLQIFTPIAKFQETCKKAKVILVHGNAGIGMVWRPGGALGNWTAPEGWEGSVEFTTA